MTDLERELGGLCDTLAKSTVAVRARGGAGAGVVWPGKNIVVTNAHVATSRRVAIVFASGEEVRGDVVRRDERADLALLQAHGSHAVPAAIRDPAGLRAGELLVAFGHPLGVHNVLTTGIAHAAGAAGAHFVRAALRLMPGNSGGPLADARGRVVGINSMVADGIAYAVRSDRVQQFVDAHAAPHAGLALAPIALGDRTSAYVVLAIEIGGLADSAGLRPGDVLGDTALGALRRGAAFEVARGGRPLRIEVRAAA
ncbi:MAG: S1C family serine protease [Candidatus Velthaea sp.]